MANNGGQYGGGGGSQANGGDGLIVVTYTPVNVATGIGILGALVCAAALAVTNPTAGSALAGPVQPFASLVATNTAAGVGVVGPVAASGTISPAGQNPANGVGIVGPVAASGTWTAKVNATGSAVSEPVLASATWSITDPANGAVSLAPPVATGGFTTTNPLAGSASVVPSAQGAWTATVNAPGVVVVGPVSAHGTLQPLGATLPVDARYYAATGVRGFYASFGLHPFYSAASLRSFYILDNPDVTPTLDTKDPRATGRGLVVLTYATMLSDRPAYFDAWMKATLADFQAKFGTQTGIQVVQKSFGYPHNGFGPWLQHLLVYGIGCAMQHGYKAEGQWALDYFATAILDSVLVTQDELSTIYNSQWSDDNGVVAKDWAQGLQFAALNQPKIAAALVCAEGSQALQAALGSGFPAGYYSGYPTEPTGYPAMMQPAMAVIREMATDQTRAIAGWTKFAANAVAHIDYSHNPKYNVIP